jgi:hypothetical protein
LDGYDDNIIDENSTENIIEYILTNDKYGPSVGELEAQYYNIFNDHLEYEYEIESESKTKGIKLIKSLNSVTRKKRNRSPSLSPIRSIEKTIQMNSPHISPKNPQDKVYNSSNRTTKKHKKSPIKELNYNRENLMIK